jgi:hypothetical protein
VQLHALGTNDELPPPPQKVDDGESPLASLGPGSPSTALAGASTLSAANGASPLAEVDDPALHEALCWREYGEHVVRLLELGTGVAETTPFEEDASLAPDRAHVWRVVGFSVRRVPCEDATAPLKLHTTDAYILLVPPRPKLADVARLILGRAAQRTSQASIECF